MRFHVYSFNVDYYKEEGMIRTFDKKVASLCYIQAATKYRILDAVSQCKPFVPFYSLHACHLLVKAVTAL